MDHIGQNSLRQRNTNPFNDNYANRKFDQERGNYPRTNQNDRDYNDLIEQQDFNQREIGDMESKLFQMQDRDNRMKRGQEQQIQSIINEEKKILEARFFDELQKVQKSSENQARNVANEALNNRNKNQKLSGAVLDKEAEILKFQNKNALLQSDLNQMKECLDLAETKIRALEAFSSDLQGKHDKLENRCREKE